MPPSADLRSGDRRPRRADSTGGVLPQSARLSSLPGRFDSPRIAVSAVDDHPLILRGLRSYLTEWAPDIRLAVLATTVDGLLAQHSTGVSVVLLDVHLGDGSSVEDNVRRLRATGAQVVLFTSEHRPAVVRRALDAGAVGLVLKEDPEANVVEAIRQADAGEFYASSRLAHQVVTDPSGLVQLSARERQVLALLARGLPWGAVARLLEMSAETARTHCYRALEKYAKAGGVPLNGPKELTFRAIADGHVELAVPLSAIR